MQTAYLLLGGNLGDLSQTFDRVVNLLEGAGVVILQRSSRYQSEPWGMVSDKMFCNQAVEVSTRLEPADLLTVLLDIEHLLGRKRVVGQLISRTIDIDILIYGDLRMSTSALVLPHPRMHLRRFALLPLFEIAPDLHHPVLDKTIEQLLAHCPDQSRVIKLEGSCQNNAS